VEAIVRLLLQGDSIPNVVQNASKNWGVSTRQVYYYVRRARTLIREEAKRVREEAFDEHLAARRRMRKEAHDANDGRLAFDILRDESKLLDLYPSAKQEITGAGGGPVQAVVATDDLSNLTDEELDARLGKLFVQATAEGIAEAGDGAEDEGGTDEH